MEFLYIVSGVVEIQMILVLFSLYIYFWSSYSVPSMMKKKEDEKNKYKINVSKGLPSRK